MKRFVIYSKINGVFLGSCMGLSFWSKLDPVGQDSACTFESKNIAQEYIDSWSVKPSFEIEFIEVECENPFYATIKECSNSNIEPWIPLGDEALSSSTVH